MLRGGGLLATCLGVLSISACMMRPPPESPVSEGSTVESLYRAFPRETAYAAACDRRTIFPDDSDFRECLERDEFIVIFRRGEFQYAYTVAGGTVRSVRVSNHTIDYP